MSSMMSSRVVSLLSKPTKERDPGQIEIIQQWLKKKSHILNSIQPDILHDVVKHCGYMKAAVNDVIITQGESGKCFYVLITGRTSVYIQTSKFDDDPSWTGCVDQALIAGDISWKNTRRNTLLIRSQYGKFIMHFEEGDSFGEIALLGEDSVRNATVIADEDSDLLVISRELFERSMKGKQEEYYEERREFIKKCPLFSFWSPKCQRLLEMSLIKEVYQFGSIIMKQGEPIKGLVFILSGQVKVVIEPAKHDVQYPKLMKTRFPNEKHATRYHHQRTSDGVTSGQIRVRRKEGYAAAEKRIMSKHIDLCSLEKNEIVGDIEMVLNLDTNIATVMSTATTEVFVLNTKNFERLVLKKNTNTIEKLRVGVFQKLSGRLGSPKSDSVPLLARLFSAMNSLVPKPDSSTQKTKAEETKDPKLKYLIELFLKDKVPLIEPFVPNSLYYRKKTASKSKQLGPESKRFYRFNVYDSMGKIQRKQPRSVGKLRNNIEAERELLGDDRVVQDETMSSLTASIRPATSYQLPIQTSPISLPRRPKTAGSAIEITECDVISNGFGPKQETEDILDHETIANLFDELEEIQRTKSDERLKAIYSGSVRSRLHDYTSSHNSVLNNEHLEEFVDWETSDKNLRGLEDRIKTFCEGIRTPNSRHKHLISEMKRFDIEDPQYMPIPGGAVFVHKKECFYPTEPAASISHKHVRRFMLARTRPTYSGLETSKVHTSSIVPISK